MRKRNDLWSLILAVALLSACGCAKKNVSQPLGDQPPDTWFVNVPQAKDTLTDRPLLFWTGKDPDGKVIAYEYVIDDTTKQWTYLTGDTTGTSKYIRGSLLKFGTPTQDTIQFEVPDLLDEHTLYVRAVDNIGLRDPTPASRSFTCKTIAPNTQILTGPSKDDTILFCLPGYTATWKGIIFGINPSDTMDPDGRVVGWYYAVDESIPNRQTWRFTTNPSCTLANLADGPHTFAVSAKDNADAIDPTPALWHFTTYRPLFNQGILLVDETKNGNGTQGFPNDAQVDSVYHTALQNAGRTWTEWEDKDGSNRPPKEVLRYYSTVIWHSDEIPYGSQYFSRDSAKIRDYLNVGGKLWLTGLHNLYGLDGDNDPNNTSYSAGTFEHDYLGLSAANTAKTNSSADSCFVGAWGVYPGYPDLLTDSMKILANQHGHLANVNTLSTAGSEVLMSYRSDPLNPVFERLPCAVRYQGPTFKTVFFGFPCYQIQIDPVTGEPLTTLFRQTLTFLGE